VSYLRIGNRAVAELKMDFWSSNLIDQTITLCVIFYRLSSRHKHVPTHTILLSVAVSDIADG